MLKNFDPLSTRKGECISPPLGGELRLSEVAGDGADHLGGEDLVAALVAQALEGAAEGGIAVYPVAEGLPCR